MIERSQLISLQYEPLFNPAGLRWCEPEYCDSAPYEEVAWSTGQSSLGHAAGQEGRTVQHPIDQPNHSYAHPDPATCPHGGESQGIWINNGSHLVCRGCGMDFT